ncbi:MAG: CNNM domain-containing protein [Pirellula sp.]
MIYPLMVILGAGALSAFCSGVETGLYRVPRVRLVLDAVDGSRVARGLLWLTNHPGLFVSTLLVGNTFANYCVPVGLAWFVLELWGYDDPRVNIAVSVLSTPILFIVSELLPKSIFHQVPHQMLRRFGWPLFALTILALPLTWALYLLSRWLQRILGEEPLKVRPALARRELRQVLEEGEQAGLLEPVQRDLVQNMFAYGSDPISRFCMPLRGFKTISLDAPIEEARELAMRTNQTIVPVLHPRDKRLVGYFDTNELRSAEIDPQLKAASTFGESDGQIAVLNKMVSQKTKLGRVVNPTGQLVGVVLLDRLVAQMLQRT